MLFSVMTASPLCIKIVDSFVNTIYRLQENVARLTTAQVEDILAKELERTILQRKTLNKKIKGADYMISMDDLEITCPECNGKGESEGTPCKKCDSKGVILTSLGQTLLYFIKKHT
ncbi:hypothetical protein [Paenibacillus tyrfis]